MFVRLSVCVYVTLATAELLLIKAATIWTTWSLRLETQIDYSFPF